MMILPKTLTQSHCYISNHTKHRALKQQYGWNFPLGEWKLQRLVSRSLFGAGGEATVRACEAHYGMFVWATEFSNVHSLFSFDEPRIVVNGEEWAGSEAYFQAQKESGLPSDHETVKRLMKNADPMEAFGIGRRYSRRSDWFDVNVDVMRKAVRAKFTQNEVLKDLLLSTGNHPLVQVKPGDWFWGTGADNNGKNMLGVLLMELRGLRNGSITSIKMSVSVYDRVIHALK